jgi:hypothetical protein
MSEGTNHGANPVLPSNEKFGWVFAAVFVLAGGLNVWNQNPRWAIALFLLAAVFAVLTLFMPTALAPLNRLWYQLGLLLGRIVSPIVLGLIFFVVITPVGLVTRLWGRDELGLKKRQVTSYWINREPVGPAPESFKNQF